MGKAHIDERVNTTVLDHLPGVLGGVKILLSIQRNVSVGISVDELNSPLNHSQQALEDAEKGHANEATNAAIVGRLLLSNRAELAQELDNGDNQAAEGNGAEAVGECALGGAAGGVLGEVVNSKVPCSVDTADDGVDGVFEPLCNPVHGKCDKDNQANDCALATVGTIGATVRVVGRRLPADVDAHHGSREPCAEGRSQQTADETDNVDVAVPFADVNTGTKHEGREGNARDPCPECKRGKDGKDEKDDAGRVVLFV